ncbi:MAG TPA: S8/S53 family peptidase [Anaerolineales bacterium]|nr:S8/S53 family peptidase [Anaerolineales bacterium]
MDKEILVEGNRKPLVPKLPNRKYGFFRDDQCTFLVTSLVEVLNTDQLEVFRQEISDVMERNGAGKIEQLPKIVSFSGLSPEESDQVQSFVTEKNLTPITGAFSIITASLTNTPEDPLVFLQAMQAVREELTQPRNDGQTEAIQPSFSNGISVAGASLNWLTSVVSQGAGTGGPGGTPSAYYGSRKNASYMFDVVRELQDLQLYGNGDGVDVVILDTAPSAHDLVAAYKEWPDHPLIQTLLGPNGKLHLYPTSYAETLRLGNTSLNGSDYKMTDHGLFIAGIIHSIVPAAEVHLIEVLNQYGVGDFQSLTDGLQRALSFRKPGRKLFVNCSWMLDFPSDEHHCHYKPTDPNQALSDPDLEFERQVRLFAEKDRSILRWMETLFIRFAAHNRGAIAAAGNDAYDDDKKQANQKHVRPKARYPAGLSTVVGVGALPVTLDHDDQKVYRTSAFSNRSDRPEKVGIATLGGEEGDGKGVLGLYIGDFPDGRLNTTKWAWWAGTSFATPILTGVIASLASGPLQTPTPTVAIDKLRLKNFLEGSTDLNEKVLATTQC